MQRSATSPCAPNARTESKDKAYCQNCLVEGAEWAATMKNLRLPADAPKRAALCALIPGMGAVYNSEYMKGITYFAVWAGLVDDGQQGERGIRFRRFCLPGLYHV